MLDRTPSTRQAVRRIRIIETEIRKAASAGRIVGESDGRSAIENIRLRSVETAGPTGSPLAGSTTADGTPFARLKVAQPARNVEVRRLALEERKRRLVDVAEADTAIDEVAGVMRDALLNWPAPDAAVIAAGLGVDPDLLQTVLQKHVTALLSGAAGHFDPLGRRRRSTAGQGLMVPVRPPRLRERWSCAAARPMRPAARSGRGLKGRQ